MKKYFVVRMLDDLSTLYFEKQCTKFSVMKGCPTFMIFYNENDDILAAIPVASIESIWAIKI